MTNPQYRLCHDDKYCKARCFPVEIDFGENGCASGYVVTLLCNGVETTDQRIATHVRAYIVAGAMVGNVVTFPYFDGVLAAPTLH